MNPSLRLTQLQQSGVLKVVGPYNPRGNHANGTDQRGSSFLAGIVGRDFRKSESLFVQNRSENHELDSKAPKT